MLEIIEHVQGSPEWKAHRMDHFNASEAPIIMGASKKGSRDELLHLKATRAEKEFSQYITDNILAGGHKSEAGARPIIEKQFGIELSAITAKNGIYSASKDGITFDMDKGWEHKDYNKELFALISAGKEPDDHIWQMEHQFLVFPDLKEIIFTVSDGTEENMASIIYKSKPARRKKLIAAWELFAKDLASYVPPAKVEKIIAEPVTELPVVVYEVKGLTISSNLDVFRGKAVELIEKAKQPLTTDQEFADAAEMVKSMSDAEKKIEDLKARVVAEFESLDQFTTSITEIGEMIRKARLLLNPKIEAEKTKRKTEIMGVGEKEVLAYLQAVNSSIVGVKLPIPLMTFQSVTKGKSSLEKIREAVNQAVADLKLGIDEQAEKVKINLAKLEEKASDLKTLFPDMQQLAFKEPEDFEMFVVARIATHEKEMEEKAKKVADEKAAQEAAKVVAPEVKQEALATIPAQAAAVIVHKPELAPSVFSDDDEDINSIDMIAQHFKSIVFPEMKTARGQEIANKAKAALSSTADKVLAAANSMRKF
jgi:predicted phage-related endonuclease